MKTLSSQSNFLGIGDEHSSFDKSKVVVLPVPYERTVSYGKGTRNGPSAILEASRYVEFYDEETRREIYRELGVATAAPVNCPKQKRDDELLDDIFGRVKELVARKKFCMMLGGEHTISQSAIAACAEKYRDLSVLQIDAHSDLRPEYEGSKFSHASVMARVCEFIDPGRIVQVGIRAQCAEEADFISNSGITTLYAHQIRSGKYTKLLKYWDDFAVEKLTPHVYVTFDVDGLDPSVIPSTGTPEPNGLQWQETMTLLKKVGRKKTVVGCDVVELAPVRGFPQSDLAAAKLVSKMINYFVR